jgi:hypothetical protein
MKKLFPSKPGFGSIGIAACLLSAAFLFSACAHVREASDTKHKLKHRAAAVPPGWSVVTVQLTNTATGNAVTAFSLIAPSGLTNQPTFWAALTAPRPKIFTDFEETWEDRNAGGGTFLLTDPTASSLAFSHTNQSALGGGRSTSIGQIQSVITTNAVALVGAAGDAAGKVIGAGANALAGGLPATAGGTAANLVKGVTPAPASNVVISNTPTAFDPNAITATITNLPAK